MANDLILNTNEFGHCHVKDDILDSYSVGNVLDEIQNSLKTIDYDIDNESLEYMSSILQNIIRYFGGKTSSSGWTTFTIDITQDDIDNNLNIVRLVGSPLHNQLKNSFIAKIEEA